MRPTIGIAAATLVAALGTVASADTMFVTDIADAGFAAAVSGASSTSEDFSSFTVDTGLSSSPGSPSSFAGFDAHFLGTNTYGGIDLQLIDTLGNGFENNGNFAIDGSSYLLAFAAQAPQFSRTVINPDAGTVAMSFDFVQWADGANRTELSVLTNFGTYTFNPNPNGVSSLQNGQLGFYTTTAGETILEVTLNALGPVDGIGLDNFQSHVQVVPLPPAALMGLGLLGLMGMIRRRKRPSAA